MDLESLAKWLIAPGGAAAGVVTWLVRRRRGSGSWIARRLAIERAYATCQEERTSDQASFTRQLATRDREIGYLMAALERLSGAAEQVIETHDAGLLTISEPSPTAPSPSPAPSPTSRGKPPTSKDR